jgi:hypothetical protein
MDTRRRSRRVPLKDRVVVGVEVGRGGVRGNPPTRDFYSGELIMSAVIGTWTPQRETVKGSQILE